MMRIVLITHLDHEATKELASQRCYNGLYVVIVLSEGSLQYIKPFFGLNNAKEKEYENRCQDEFDDDNFKVDGEVTSNGEAIIRGDEWRIVSIDCLVKYELEGLE